MSKKVFVYLPEKEMEAFGVDPAPYKEKLHQVAESLCGELLTDVIESCHDEKNSIEAYMEFLKRCQEADVIITIDTYNAFNEGARNRSWHVSAEMLRDIQENSDKRLFVVDSNNLFTQKELDDLYKKWYKDQREVIPCAGEAKITNVREA